MLGRQFAALGEAAAGEDVSVGRAHVAFVRTVLSYAVEEGFHREDVLVWELRGTVFRRVCGVHPMESFPGLIECSLGDGRAAAAQRLLGVGAPEARSWPPPTGGEETTRPRPSPGRYGAIGV